MAKSNNHDDKKIKYIIIPAFIIEPHHLYLGSFGCFSCCATRNHSSNFVVFWYGKCYYIINIWRKQDSN